MNASWRGIIVAVSLFVITPAFAQSVVIAPKGELVSYSPRMTPSRVLAGLRGYSDQIVAALVRLAEHPQLLERAAEDVWAGQQPAVTAVPAELRAAFELLARSPEALLVAATHPEELQLLRSLWSVAPEGATMRLRQLRAGYERAAREGATAWQRALEDDPVALGEYRDLLTGLCEAEREAAPGLACVRVSNRRYYYACPPDEAVAHYANEVGVPPSLSRVLAGWWSEHAPQRVDAKLANMRAVAPAVTSAPDSVYDWPAQKRAPMWQPAEAGDVNNGLGLVPVALQPPADQPPAARLALAVVEHARLWGPPVPVAMAPGVEVVSRPPAVAEEPVIIVEEPIPGPQTAQRDDIVVYDDISYQNRREYVLPRYTGLYYGYSVTGPYYCDPIYYARSGYSVVYPSHAYYSRDPYRSGGVHLRVGYAGHRYSGPRVYGSGRTERIHYGGGRHYGSTSVSVGGRSGRHSRHVYISTRDRSHGARVYRQHGSRAVLPNRGAIRGSSGSRVGHGGSATRGGIRSGTRGILRSGAREVIRTGARRAIRSGVRAVKSRIREIRSRSGAERSGPRVTRGTPRPSGRAVRPSSHRGTRRSPSISPGRSGAQRRR